MVWPVTVMASVKICGPTPGGEASPGEMGAIRKKSLTVLTPADPVV